MSGWCWRRWPHRPSRRACRSAARNASRSKGLRGPQRLEDNAVTQRTATVRLYAIRVVDDRLSGNWTFPVRGAGPGVADLTSALRGPDTAFSSFTAPVTEDGIHAAFAYNPSSSNLLHRFNNLRTFPRTHAVPWYWQPCLRSKPPGPSSTIAVHHKLLIATIPAKPNSPHVPAAPASPLHQTTPVPFSNIPPRQHGIRSQPIPASHLADLPQAPSNASPTSYIIQRENLRFSASLRRRNPPHPPSKPRYAKRL